MIVDPDIAFLARYAGAHIVAGAIANRHAGAVGLSNVFGPAKEDMDTRSACLVLAGTLFPDLPIVGYEGADKREGLLQLGFTPIGPLRVWQRSG